MKSYLKADWDSKLPIYKISQSKLIKDGISCILLDVDGTLLSRSSSTTPKKVRKWIENSKQFFNLYLVSNNPSQKRIAKVGQELGLSYKYKALKPSKKITSEIINLFNVENKKIAIIGDRIFTDIFVGNRCRINTILVRKLNRKGCPINFDLTLLFERFISLLIV